MSPVPFPVDHSRSHSNSHGAVDHEVGERRLPRSGTPHDKNALAEVSRIYRERPVVLELAEEDSALEGRELVQGGKVHEEGIAGGEKEELLPSMLCNLLEVFVLEG